LSATGQQAIVEASLMMLNAAALTLALAAALHGDDVQPQGKTAAQSGWRYVLPAPGDPFDHAPFRALVLAREKPEELVELAAYRGEKSRRRYARIRFGSPSSTRVTIVLDETPDGKVDLYVDADRNLRIDDRDRANSADSGQASRGARIWRMPLDVALVENDTVRTIPRAVVFRLGASGQTLGYATAGYVDGTVALGRKSDSKEDKSHRRLLAARRVDGDGNGFLADTQDRLFIDLNGDGQFNSASEQFLFNTVLTLEGSRYVVRSDQLGNRLAIDPLEGTGTLQLAFKARNNAASVKVVEMRATAIGRDGSVFALSGIEPATVPAGDYRLSNLTLSLDDAKSGQVWSFVFSDGLWSGPPHWYKVEKDAAVTIDPVGKPAFELRRFDSNKVDRPGDDVVVQPALYTGDGLLIIVAYCGAPVSPSTQELLGARIALVKTDSETVATAHSGFS
jgi:hypothetical protein